MEQPRFGHNDSSKVSAKGGFPGLLFGRHQATVNSNVQAVVCGPCGRIRTSNRLPEADWQSPSRVSVLLLCFYNSSRCHANTPCRCAVWLDQVICTWRMASLPVQSSRIQSINTPSVTENLRSTGALIGIPFHPCHPNFKGSGQRHNSAGLNFIFW